MPLLFNIFFVAVLMIDLKEFHENEEVVSHTVRVKRKLNK